MNILLIAIDIYWWVIIASAVISWFPIPRDNPLIYALNAMTQPVYRVIHKVLDPSKTYGIDVSPLIVLIALSFLRDYLASLD